MKDMTYAPSTRIRTCLFVIFFVSIFSSNAQDTLFGNPATLLNPQTVEINPSTKSTYGWAFSMSKFRLDQKTTMKFNVYLGSKKGSGGMVFMLQNDPRGLLAQGCVGEGMGYGSNSKGPTCPECGNGTRKAISPSIGIEFDTETNSATGDPAQQHLAYLENGNVNHGSSYVALPDFTDNKLHTFQITWDPVTDSLTVYFDSQKRIAIKKDIQNLIFKGAATAYWGFSGSTETPANQHYFSSTTTTFSMFNNFSKASGYFDDPATWLSGSIPATTDQVVVLHGHTIQLRKNEALGGISISSGGTLKLSGFELALNNSDLINKGTISSSNGSLRFNGTVAQNIYLKDSISFNNISNYNSAGTVLKSGHILLTGTLLPSAGNFNTGNNVTLVSTASQTGRIAELGNGASITGKVTVQRYIAASTSIYRYLASPVQNAYVSDWQNEIPITGTFTNPSNVTGLKPTSKSLYYYNEATAGDLNLGYVNYPASGSSTTAALVPGKGYSIYVLNNTGHSYVDVTGTPNTGNQNVTITYTNSGNTNNDGWNLIGNPYPSQINWDLVAASLPAGVGKAVYFTDNDEPGGRLVRSYVNGIGVPSSTKGIISSSQAFWIKATSAGTYTVPFREKHKVANNAALYKTAAPSDLLRIQLIKNQQEWDEAVITLADAATSSFDLDYDALKMKGPSVNLSSLSKEKQLLSINSLSQTAGTDTVALNIGALSDGDYSFNFSGIESFSATELFLLDNSTMETYPLGQGYKHSFTINSASKNNDSLRFSVVMKTAATTSVSSKYNSQTKLEIFPNPVDDSRILNLSIPSDKSGNLTISLLDIAGKTVFETEATGTSLNNGIYTQIQLPEINKGIYTVILKTGDEEFHKNLLVK